MRVMVTIMVVTGQGQRGHSVSVSNGDEEKHATSD